MTEKDATSWWRWVILMSSFFSLLITGYAQYHAGVMKVALLRHLDSDESFTTWLMSYYAGSFALAAPVGSIVLNVTNCRTCVVLSGIFCLLGFVLSSLVTDITYLFLTMVLVGIGQGMANTGGFIILGYYFPDHASIALGVSISGGALGIFMHPPLLQSLVDGYGLQGALLLSGAIAFQGSVFGALMRPCSLELRATQGRPGGNVLQRLCALCDGARHLHRSPLTSRAMAVFLLSVFIFSLAFHSLLVLLPYHLIHVGGLTPTEASFSVSVSGIGSFISRLSAGFLAHDPRVGYVLVYSGLIGVQTVVSIAAPSLIGLGLGGSYAYTFMVGLYTGGVFPLFYPILLQIVGLDHVATALGLALFSFGVGGLVGAPLTELVHGGSSHPYVMFGFIGALFCVATVLGSLVTSVLPSDPSPPGLQPSPSSSSPSSPSSSSSSSPSRSYHRHHHQPQPLAKETRVDETHSPLKNNPRTLRQLQRLLDHGADTTAPSIKAPQPSHDDRDDPSADVRDRCQKGCDGDESGEFGEWTENAWDRCGELPDRSKDSPDRSKGIPDRSKGSPDRSKGSPDRSKDSPDRSKGSPDRSKDSPDRSKDSPDRSKDSPDRSKDIPGRSKDSPDRSKDIPGRSKDIPDRSKDIPDRSKDIPGRSKDSPDRSKDIPDRSKDIPGRSKDSPDRESPEVTQPLLHGVADTQGSGTTKRVGF